MSEFFSLRPIAKLARIFAVGMMLVCLCEKVQAAEEPLLDAAEKGDLKEVQRLLDARVSVNEKGFQGWSALICAIQYGHPDVAKLLIERGAAVNQRSMGFPLGAAICRGQTEVVKLLLARGADPDVADSAGYSALDYAEEKGSPEILKLVAAASHRSEDTKNKEQLLRSIRSRDQRGVETLLRAGRMSQSTLYSGLITAAAAGNLEAARWLIESGSDARVWNEARYTSLLFAAIRGDAEMAKLLLADKADVNMGHIGGYTPLMAAAASGSAALVSLLLEAGADPHQADLEGRTALGIALDKKDPAIAKLLEAAGARPTAAVREAKKPVTPAPGRPPAAVPFTIAIAPFSSEDNSFVSNENAAALAALLQTQSGLKGLRWVERAEIQKAENELRLSANGFPGSGDGIQLGKWVKADLLVRGRLGLDEGQGRTLEIEVVDLQRADLLARRSFPIKGNLGAPFQFSAADVALSSRLVGEAVSESAGILARTKSRTVVAPLFFRNTSTTGGRLNFLEEELAGSFAEVAAPDLRILQFPRASDGAEEADLAVSGLVESDPDAWKGVADRYVWGSFSEVDSADVPFEKVRIKVELQIWDGRGAPQKIEETLTVGDRKNGFSALAKRALEIAREKGSGEPGDAVRDDVAASLLARSREIGEKSGLSMQSQRYRTRLLEAARFFAPGNAEIDREYIVEKWHESATFRGDRNLTTPRQFWARWRQSDAWGKHAERFGLDSIRKMSVAKNDQAGRQKFRAGLGGIETYVHLPFVVARDIGYQDGGYPEDAPSAVHRAWRSAAMKEFVGRLKQAADEDSTKFEQNIYMFGEDINWLPDSRLRAEALAAFWKIYSGKTVREVDRSRLEGTLKAALAEAGLKPEDPVATSAGPQVGDTGTRYGGGLSWNDKKKKVHEWEKQLAASVPGPGEIKLEFRSIALGEPEDCNSVDLMAVQEGHLWMAVQMRRGPRFLIWTADVSTGKTTSLKNLQLASQEFSTLSVRGNDLWLGTEGSGAWRFDTKSKVLRQFTGRDGLPAMNLLSEASTLEGIYFGGEEQGQGRLGFFDFHKQSWSLLARKTLEPSKMITGLACHGPWLFTVESDKQGRGPSYFVSRKGEWKAVYGIPVSLFKLCQGDSSGIWVAGGRTLALFQPDKSESQVLFPSRVRLDGDITAIARDGEFLWVATFQLVPQGGQYARCTTQLVLVHVPSRRVVTRALVPFNSPVLSLAVSGEKIWLGLDTRYDSETYLLEANAAAFQAVPEANWQGL